MQLLIILALLLFSGKNNAGNVLSEVKPVLESLGGEEMKEALKSAEQISEVLSAVQELGAMPASQSVSAVLPEQGQNASAAAFPLSPISSIADKDITYSLSKYISQN